MSADDAAFLAALPGSAFAFVAVLARVSAAVMAMPGFGQADLPMTVRAGLALVLTLLLLPLLAPLVPAEPASIAAVAALLAGELVAGIWLGWLARLLTLALPLAGQIIALMTGLSSVLIADPDIGGQGPGLSRLFDLLVPVVIFGFGLHAELLAAFVGSYHLIPPGTWFPAGDTARTILAGVAASFALALRLAAPFVLAGTLWQIGLALFGRLVPRIQIYFIAMPAQILGGIVLLAVLLRMVVAAWIGDLGPGFVHLPGFG
jgi:flagellar biosynthetic protein FliR